MRFPGFAGNDALRRRLEGEQRRGLSHAYLLCGPEGSGRHQLARILAAVLNCRSEGEQPCEACPPCRKIFGGIHPDVQLISPEKSVRSGITVDQIRELRRDAFLRPNEAERKCYILEHCENLAPASQNALLKVLEEGPEYDAFFLLTENAQALLPTIRSRCVELALEETGERQRPEARERAERFALALAAREEQKLAFALFEMEKQNREEAAAFLEECRELLQAALRQKLGGPAMESEGARALCAALTKKELLGTIEVVRQFRSDSDFNVNVGLLLGQLAVACWEELD